MSQSRKVLLVASGVIAGALLAPPGIAAAKDAVQAVLITNGPDQPVPVTGVVGVANTPDQPVPVAGAVGVTNTADQPVPVTGTVGVGGTVAVDGTVSVRDAGAPFETRVDLVLPAGEPFASFAFQVPAGQRLVVEFVSAQISVPSGQTPLLSANAQNGALGFSIPLQFQGTGATATFWTGAIPAVDFAPSGFYLFNLERQVPGGGPVSGSASGFVYISGHLLPA